MDDQKLLLEIAKIVEASEERMNQKILDSEERTNQKFKTLSQEIKDSEVRIAVKIENEITQRLEALTDAYKVAYEKEYELLQRQNCLEQRQDRLEARFLQFEKSNG